MHFGRLLEFLYWEWKCYQKCFGLFGSKPSESCFVVKALGESSSSSPQQEVFSHTPPRVIANVLANLQPKTYSFPFQGWLRLHLPIGVWARGHKESVWLSPWMLFSCHTFPKRLAAAPIVAAEGGLLSWSFRPPAIALVSDGFIVRERGPNNGRQCDVMLPTQTKS